METQPQEVLDDVGVALPFKPNLKALAKRAREHTEFAAEPIRAIMVWPQKVLENGLKRARAAVSLTEMPDFGGDNTPAPEALAYARVRSQR